MSKDKMTDKQIYERAAGSGHVRSERRTEDEGVGNYVIVTLAFMAVGAAAIAMIVLTVVQRMSGG